MVLGAELGRTLADLQQAKWWRSTPNNRSIRDRETDLWTAVYSKTLCKIRILKRISEGPSVIAETARLRELPARQRTCQTFDIEGSYLSERPLPSDA